MVTVPHDLRTLCSNLSQLQQCQTLRSNLNPKPLKPYPLPNPYLLHIVCPQIVQQRVLTIYVGLSPINVDRSSSGSGSCSGIAVVV